jgi:glycosyltransferase involved in cell wall biosynthesis
MRRLTGNSFPTILFASRLVWEKNLETLFRIYDLIQYKKLKVNLVIAGDGVARKAAKQRMSNAIFTRQLDHQLLSVLYASADVFLFPSISETYGNVVLEAMASGLPCVIADGGGSKDFIEQGTTGFKCRPCDELDYVEKIEVLLSNRELHKQFANEGIRFSEKSCWAALADVYFDDLMSLAQPQYV